MKKRNIILVFFLLFLATACSLKQWPVTSINEKSAPPSTENYDSNDVISRINAIKNGLTPIERIPGQATAPAGGQQAQDNGQAGPGKNIRLENLATQFSQAVIKTNFGDIKVGFYAQEAPLTVNNFMNLVKQGFYDGTKFHRVIKNFVIQGGDPLSKDNDWSDDGRGGPGYTFKDEINSHKLVQGSLAMANSGPNTNGSQFFILTKEAAPELDGKYTNFGYVVLGMAAVKKIETVKTNENDHPLEDVVIKGIELVK